MSHLLRLPAHALRALIIQTVWLMMQGWRAVVVAIAFVWDAEHAGCYSRLLLSGLLIGPGIVCAMKHTFITAVGWYTGRIGVVVCACGGMQHKQDSAQLLLLRVLTCTFHAV